MRRFLSVIKPGIIFGNIVSCLGGFFLASPHPLPFDLLFSTLISMSLVIASACVFNNYIDRDIDQVMERTRHRVLAQGKLSHTVALLYASLLGVLGFWLFYFTTNWLTLGLAFFGWFVYVVPYSLSMKRHSRYGTLIGAISGAIPPVVGYCAVNPHLDVPAFLLFFILFFWQMPHFYAIAIYRLHDFQAAKIPVLPLQKGIAYTKRSILIYILLFTAAALMPSVFINMSWIYSLTALLLGLGWFWMGINSLNKKQDRAWARKMFVFSILNITLLCLAMAIKI